MKNKYYYHFTGSTLRDERPIPPIGEWLTHEGPLKPCESGLHASEHPFDALRFALGYMLHRVELAGEIIPHGEPIDKVCARRRKILATIDAGPVLGAFARRVALDVLPLWPDAPEIVKRYLETGDETIRAVSWDAARDAALDAVWAAAWAAVWAASGADAWTAAWAAALDAARDAALGCRNREISSVVSRNGQGGV